MEGYPRQRDKFQDFCNTTLARIVRGDPLPDAEVFKRFKRDPEPDHDPDPGPGDPLSELPTWPRVWRQRWHQQTRMLVDGGCDWKSAETRAFEQVAAERKAGTAPPVLRKRKDRIDDLASWRWGGADGSPGIKNQAGAFSPEVFAAATLPGSDSDANLEREAIQSEGSITDDRHSDPKVSLSPTFDQADTIEAENGVGPPPESITTSKNERHPCGGCFRLECRFCNSDLHGRPLADIATPKIDQRTAEETVVLNGDMGNDNPNEKTAKKTRTSRRGFEVVHTYLDAAEPVREGKKSRGYTPVIPTPVVKTEPTPSFSSRVNVDEETKKWLESFPIRQHVVADRFEEDALIYREFSDSFATAKNKLHQLVGFRSERYGSKLYRLILRLWPLPPISTWTVCDKCHGTGKSDKPLKPCRTCHGDGYVIPGF